MDEASVNSAWIPLRFRHDSASILLRFRYDSAKISARKMREIYVKFACSIESSMDYAWVDSATIPLGFR